jgi:hypothetical protein
VGADIQGMIPRVPPAAHVAEPLDPWYRMPMLFAAFYCAVVVAVAAAVLLLPIG